MNNHPITDRGKAAEISAKEITKSSRELALFVMDTLKINYQQDIERIAERFNMTVADLWAEAGILTPDAASHPPYLLCRDTPETPTETIYSLHTGAWAAIIRLRAGSTPPEGHTTQIAGYHIHLQHLAGPADQLAAMAAWYSAYIATRAQKFKKYLL